MAKIEWDKTGSRYYETGVDHCALYLQEAGKYKTGVAWNGISSISESPSGGDSNAIYADNIKYLDLTSKEDFGASIEAYTYPDEWAICDGSAEPVPGVKLGQQERRRFGLVYRTRVGNDSEGDGLGYKLHIIYNAKASPSERSYTTVNDSPEALTFSWEITTTEVTVPNYRPTSNMNINSVTYLANDDAEGTKAAQLAALEDLLFGTDSEDAYLPDPAQVIAILDGSKTYAQVLSELKGNG